MTRPVQRAQPTFADRVRRVSTDGLRPTAARVVAPIVTGAAVGDAAPIDRVDTQAAGIAAHTRADAGTVGFVAAVDANGATPATPLLDSWRKATLKAAAVAIAEQKLAPELQAVIADGERALGRKLEPKELAAILTALREAHAPELQADAETALAKLTTSTAVEERTIANGMKAAPARLVGRFDPFTPIVRGDAAARKRELVLFESPSAVVVIDLFAEKPKALVLAKQATAFPVIAHDRGTKPFVPVIDVVTGQPLVDELARVARSVSDAFSATQGCGPSEIWINPPQSITVGQLHVHVMPHDLEGWNAGVPGSVLGDKVPAAVRARVAQIAAALTAALAAPPASPIEDAAQPPTE